MNITERTCANCAAFNSAPTDDEAPCWNLVSITDDGVTRTPRRLPGPGDYCSDHLTTDEDAANGMAMDAVRLHKADGTPEFLAAIWAIQAMGSEGDAAS